MTLQTGFWLLAGIDDEFSGSAAGGDVFAARSMARFAALLNRDACGGELETRVRTGEEDARNCLMALGASFVAGVGGAFDLRRRDDGSSFKTCTGVQEHDSPSSNYGQEQGDKDAFHRTAWVFSGTGAVKPTTDMAVEAET